MTLEKNSSEPSIDEILASIRQIISEDSKGKNNPLLNEDNDDILDLTNLLPDESSFLMQDKEKANENNKVSSSRQKAERLQPFSKNTLEESRVDPSPSPESIQTLEALPELTQVESQASKQLLNGNAATQPMENLIHEILRPLLKEWLDANLPLLVRWVVNEKVEKIIRQGGVFPPELHKDASR